MTLFNFKNQKGFTFIETLISVSLLLSLIIVSSSMLKAISLSYKVRLKQTADSILSEQIDYIRHIPFDQLATVKNAPFRGILYHMGEFRVTDQQAQSGEKSLFISSHESGHESTVTALTTPPVGTGIIDGTFSTNIYISSSNTSGWKVGILFRATDLNNTYELTVDDNSLDFISLADGVPSTLFTKSATLALNTWHSIEITSSGQNFDVVLNGIKQNPTPINNSIHEDGGIALIGFGKTEAYFDNVNLTTAVTTKNWNFDSIENEINRQAKSWKRAGLYSLPNATGELTISDAEADPTSPLKHVQATVRWNDGIEKSESIETYVAQTGISK